MNMQVSEYVTKKTFGKKITIKDKFGGYTSNDKTAEVIVTFTGDIDPIEANKLTEKYLQDLFKDADTDEPAWLKGNETT